MPAFCPGQRQASISGAQRGHNQELRATGIVPGMMGTNSLARGLGKPCQLSGMVFGRPGRVLGLLG